MAFKEYRYELNMVMKEGKCIALVGAVSRGLLIKREGGWLDLESHGFPLSF